MSDRAANDPRLAVRRMAQFNGLDLVRLQRVGKVTADEVSAVIQNCGRCRHWQECRSVARSGATRPVRAPGYCRNRPWFDALRQRLKEEATS